jgi:hypothetical protein
VAENHEMRGNRVTLQVMRRVVRPALQCHSPGQSTGDGTMGVCLRTAQSPHAGLGFAQATRGRRGNPGKDDGASQIGEPRPRGVRAQRRDEAAALKSGSWIRDPQATERNTPHIPRL